MKKKVISLIISCFLVFNSFITSFANPYVIGKIAGVSLIYSIGRLAFDSVGFVGTIADVIDLGGTIYSKMTDQEKEYYENSVKFENDKFTYSEDSLDYIKSYIPSNGLGFHLMTGVYRTYIPNIYHGESSPPSDISDLFESNKEVIEFQGTKYDFFVYSHDSISGYKQVILYYKLSSQSVDSIQNRENRVKRDIDIYYKLYISSLTSTTGTLSAYLVTDTFEIKITLINGIPNSCDNCPHDISLKDSYDYPTKEELDYLEEKYPQYENDIVVPGGSTGGGSTGGGSTGGGSTNSPIITNPPSFPNLQEFDFSGLNIESLGDVFSNFTTKLPFSLPFDLFNLIDGFLEEPIAPIFDINFFGETLTLDLTEFEELAGLVRMFTLVGYIISLIMLTKKFGG